MAMFCLPNPSLLVEQEKFLKRSWKLLDQTPLSLVVTALGPEELLPLQISTFQIGFPKFTEGGNQTQLKTAIFAIKSTRVLIYLCTLEFYLFSLCKSKLRLILHFVTTYTSVQCRVYFMALLDLFL